MYHFYKGFHSHLNIKDIQFPKVFEDIRCLGKMWWEEFEQGTPKDGRSVKNICFFLETSWSSALNFSCSEVTHIQGKTSSYWWLTCHGPSKSPHVLGNVIFWRVVNLFKGEEAWKRAEVCTCGTFSFAAEAAKRLENRSTGQITLFLTSGKISDTDTYWKREESLFN